MKYLKMGSRHFDILPVTADTVIKKFLANIHCHNHIELWYVFKGEMRHVINGREYFQTPGTFSLVRAYTPHLTDTTVSDETPVIFSATASEAALLELGYDCFLRHRSFASFDGRELPEFIKLTGKRRTDADFIARELLNEDFRKAPDSPKRRLHLFAKFLSVVNMNMPQVKTTRSLREKTAAINEAADYMARHCKEKLSLDNLSERALMSKRRFTDNFKTITGMTTGDFITLHRMFHADQLLCFTEKTLDVIAAELGYYDKSSFSHAFSAYSGMTPSEYRKENTEDSYKWESGERLKRARRYETLSYYYALAHNGEKLPKTSVSAMPHLI